MIIENTNRYAQQKNEDFHIDAIHLKRYLGVLILSGYHVLPTIRDYWSNHPTLGIPVVKQCMSRNKFLKIQKYLHFCDNYNLDKNDKMAKVLYSSSIFSDVPILNILLSLYRYALYMK